MRKIRLPVRLNLLVAGCRSLADAAAAKRVRVAFEPEPGMFIDTMARFAELHERVRHPAFGLCLDVGHLICLNDGDPAAHIERWAPVLWQVHLDDMRPGVHDHLQFGEGVVDLRAVLAALERVGYEGGAAVELSRHSYDAVNTARRAWAALEVARRA